MGVRPYPIVYGDDCLDCYPAGKTIKEFKLFFSGIQCGEHWDSSMGQPPNGYFDLLQHPVDHCDWYDTLAFFPFIRYKAAPINSSLRMSVRTAVYAFEALGYPVCSTYFVNGHSTYEGTFFFGGWAMIITPSDIRDVIESVTPMIDPDPRMELFVKANGHIVIRYAGKRDATNISIEVDTSI